MKNETKGMLLGLVGVIAFGLTLPVTKIAIIELDPIFIGLGRSAFAVLFAIPILLIFTKKIPNIKQFLLLAVVSLGVVVGFPIFSSIAMLHTPASHGAIILAIMPLATTAVAVMISRERPSLSFWLVSLLGSFLVILYVLWKGVGEFQAGDIALIGAVIAASIGYAVGAKLSKELGGWQVICWAIVLAFPFVVIPVFHYAPVSFAEISLDGFLSFLYLSLISQLLAFFAWYKGLALGGIARVSQVQLLQVFITIFASVILINEEVDQVTIIFSLLVVSSVWLGKRMPINEVGK